MPIAKSKKILSALVASTCVLGLFVITRTWKSIRQPIPKVDEFPKQAPPDIPGTFYLRTVRIPDEVRVHLLDGNFKIVRRVDEISNSCMGIFESSFVTISGSRVKSGEFSLANPGEAFQASDNIVLGLPFRRLEFAGLETSKCFIHYQSGGQPSSFCLAVIDYAKQKTVWAGEYYEAAADMEELRQMLVRGRFSDALGRGC